MMWIKHDVVHGFPLSKEEQVDHYKALQTIQDRVFIAKEIEKLNLFDRWGESIKLWKKTGDVGPFEDGFEVLRKEIVEQATKI